MCHFKAKPFISIPTEAYSISKSEFLVTTNELSYTLLCKEKFPLTKTAKPFFLLGIPCSCEVHIGSLVLPNSHINCNTTEHHLYTIHATNLPLLLALNMKPSTFTTSHIHIPELHLTTLNSLLNHRSALPSDATVLLRPLADILLKTTKANKVQIEKSLTTPSSELINDIMGSSLIGYLGPILFGASLILSLYTLCKVSQLAPVTVLPTMAHTYTFFQLFLIFPGIWMIISYFSYF